MAFTQKQDIFITEYLKCWNASEAARRAGYSEKTAPFTGAENLKKPKISEEIERRKKELIMQPDEIYARLTEQARGEHSKYITGEGTVDLTTMVDEGKAHLIKKIKPNTHGIEIEFHDSQSALALMAKLAGLDKNHGHVDVVNYTHDEWKAEQEKQKRSVAETFEDFADDE